MSSSGALQTAVSPLARTLDMLGVALVLAGAMCYGWAYVGMSRIHEALPNAPIILFAALGEYNRYARISHAGIVFGAAGVGMAIVSTVVSHRERHAAPPLAASPDVTS